MRTRRLDHLDDVTLLGRLRTLVTQERAAIATLLVHLAEVEARRLHLPAGYSSMFEYCVREFVWTRQTTYKRIGAARAARRFPTILRAIADGRLNISGVILLRPKLTRENADELLAAAAHRSKSEIELLLAERFPKRDVATRLVAAPVPAPPIGGESSMCFETVVGDQLSPGIADSSPMVAGEPTKNERPAPSPRLVPLAPERFALQVTIGAETHALLRRAQELLSYQCHSGDVAQVLHRALVGLVRDLEKRKYAVTDQTRAPQGHEAKGRHIPAHVRRGVHGRDQGRCTFVSESGHRCEARTQLEFDHVLPVARGGAATIDNIRLRCRAHNQYGADEAFGRAFMNAIRRRRAPSTEPATCCGP